MTTTLDSTALNRLLFMRQEIGVVVQAIRDKRISLEDADRFLTEILEEAFNYKRCFNNCKSMYFCEKKENHSGKHTCCNGALGWTSEEGFDQ